MATRVTLRTRLREHLGETTAGFYTDAELNAWLDEAQIQVAKRILGVDESLLLTSGTINWTDGTSAYVLPTGLWKLHLVERLDTSGNVVENLDPVNIRDKIIADSAVVSGIPYGQTAFFLQSSNIVFAPTPAETQTAAVRLWYQALPALLADDSTESDLPNDVEDLVVLNAAIRGFMKFGDTARYTIYSDLFAKEMSEYVDSGDKRIMAPRYVRTEEE